MRHDYLDDKEISKCLHAIFQKYLSTENEGMLHDVKWVIASYILLMRLSACCCISQVCVPHNVWDSSDFDIDPVKRLL